MIQLVPATATNLPRVKLRTMAVDLTDLPPLFSPFFFVLVAIALSGPYLLTLSTYVYHFRMRKSGAKLRTAADPPKPAHVTDWKSSIRRPEGISAVVGYYFLMGLVVEYGLGVPVIPKAMRDLDPLPKPLVVSAYFFVFDSLMWIIHFTQHNNPWLYRNTHAVHHQIKSPTILVALTGYLPDTCLLIIVPLHATLFIVPGGNFASIFVFSAVSLLHLHMIHSEFVHAWDPILRALGLVNSWDHHVHHLRPKRNLAHFFTVLDRMFGTYDDPSIVPQLKAQLAATMPQAKLPHIENLRLGKNRFSAA